MVDQISESMIRSNYNERSQGLLLMDGSKKDDHRTIMASTSNNNSSSNNNNEQFLQYGSEWVPYLCTPAENVGHYNFSDQSSSDGDLR